VSETSYDRVPYHSVALPQTHPDRLATVARLFGLDAPAVARCRVLELGCASGGNLIPMAFNLPGSQFVGLDLSGHQVAEARATIAALGLENIRVEQASVLDVGPAWGTFDYVIAHGVFSWVERDVQDGILAVARDTLSPEGLAYISYNTYPGWHMREMVRHMMRYHVAQFDEPDEQIDQARALLAFLASASEGSGPYGDLLRREVDRLDQTSNAYLFHEHLEPTNSPIYFHQFIERAERAGLLYLSEVSVSDMLTSHFPKAVADTLERISPDLLHLEQYLDFVRNRQFRQTILCHAGRKPSRALTPDSLRGLLLSSRARPASDEVDLTPGVTVEFSNGKQRATATLPASKSAYAILAESWPCALPLDDLCDRAIERARPHLAHAPLDETRQALMGDLFGGVVYGMIGTHTQAPQCTNAPSDAPRAHPLAFYQAQQGVLVANAHHEACLIDGLQRDVLGLCDGQQRVADIVDLLAARYGRRPGPVDPAGDGSLPLNDDDRTIEAGGVTGTLDGRVEEAVLSLTRQALLVE
jgi:methyltransferase-like protein/SAM-dependent methyltransferase